MAVCIETIIVTTLKSIYMGFNTRLNVTIKITPNCSQCIAISIRAASFSCHDYRGIDISSPPMYGLPIHIGLTWQGSHLCRTHRFRYRFRYRFIYRFRYRFIFGFRYRFRYRQTLILVLVLHICIGVSTV